MATVGEALHGRANLVFGRRRETETGGEEPPHADNHLKNRVVHNTNTSRFRPFDKALGRVGAKTAGKAVERPVPVTRIYPTFIDATSAE
jgi:hypothetical protein